MNADSLLGDLDPEPRIGTATFSPDRAYRYVLTRRWSRDISSHALFVGLNPSKAAEGWDQNDNTIRKEIAFARRIGHGAMKKVNIFGLVSTDSLGLLSVQDPVGPQNDQYLMELTGDVRASVIVCWGSHRRTKALTTLVAQRAAQVLGVLRQRGIGLFCFGINSDLQPKHTLYLAGDTPLRVFAESR